MAAPKKKTTKTTASKKRIKAENTTGVDLPKDVPENDVYFQKEFEIYVLWKSLPPMLKGETPKDLEEVYFIDNEDLIELLQIRTQGQFADHFKLHKDTLTRWNKKLVDRDVFADIRAWSNSLMKNVIFSTYRSAMSKDPKANSDRKLFLQTGGWGEEMTVNAKGETLTELFKRGLGIE